LRYGSSSIDRFQHRKRGTPKGTRFDKAGIHHSESDGDYKRKSIAIGGTPAENSNWGPPERTDRSFAAKFTEFNRVTIVPRSQETKNVHPEIGGTSKDGFQRGEDRSRLYSGGFRVGQGYLVGHRGARRTVGYDKRTKSMLCRRP